MSLALFHIITNKNISITPFLVLWLRNRVICFHNVHSYFRANPTRSSTIKHLCWDWLNEMNRHLAGTFLSVASMKVFLKNSSHLPIGCDLSCRFLISWSFSSIAWCKRTWNSLSFWTNSSSNLWSNGNKAHISFSSFKFSGKERSYYT